MYGIIGLMYNMGAMPCIVGTMPQPVITCGASHTTAYSQVTLQ